MSLLQQQLATYNITIDTVTFPFTQFKYPTWCIIFYLMAVFYFQPPASNDSSTSKTKTATSNKDKKKPITTLKLFMFAHNMILCIFSGLCFYRSFPVVAAVFNEYGFERAVCGKWQSQYANGIDSVFGFWVFAFYLSKIYEFIDTFIIIARGRRPMFLQTFHHCGAVLGMWMVLVTWSLTGHVFLVFNSFIHTIMYFYYAMSSINIRLPGKKLLTQAQMFQFVSANALALSTCYRYGDCMTWEDKFAGWYHFFYASALIILFKAFYSKAYNSGKKKGKSC